jgi:hypothetical protein
MKVKTFRIIIIIVSILIIILLSTIAFKYFTSSTSNTNKVCMTTNEYNRLKPIIMNPMPMQDRDKKVLEDPLYPPLNREDTDNFKKIITNPLFNEQTYQIDDKYRMIGYITYNNNDGQIDKGGNNWKMFGRMKDRNQGDYYIIPVNNNYDLKIPLTSDIIVGERLRDIYTIPNTLRFRSPMLNNNDYDYTELPKTDYTNTRYV